MSGYLLWFPINSVDSKSFWWFWDQDLWLSEPLSSSILNNSKNDILNFEIFFWNFSNNQKYISGAWKEIQNLLLIFWEFSEPAIIFSFQTFISNIAPFEPLTFFCSIWIKNFTSELDKRNFKPIVNKSLSFYFLQKVQDWVFVMQEGIYFWKI